MAITGRIGSKVASSSALALGSVLASAIVIVSLIEASEAGVASIAAFTVAASEAERASADAENFTEVAFVVEMGSTVEADSMAVAVGSTAVEAMEAAGTAK